MLAERESRWLPPFQIVFATSREYIDVTGTPTPEVRDHETNAILHGMDIDPRVAGRDNGRDGLWLKGQHAAGSRRTATGKRAGRDDRPARATRRASANA